MSRHLVSTYRSHTAYSDPGPYAHRLQELSAEPEEIAAIARNVIVHYRAYASEVDPVNASDIDARWIAAILDIDAKRHGDKPLSVPRNLASRVQGCCRDHTLFCVSVLRHHGIPARSRVGWARYLTPGFNHDHVIVEYHDGEQWRRFDSEFKEALPLLPEPYDIPKGWDAPFVTAAEAWLAYRRRVIDPDLYGVAPKVPIGGPWMLQSYVLMELAHRMGDELLLWDAWGAMACVDGVEKARRDGPDHTAVEVADEIAELLVRADGGDGKAEKELEERYATDDKVRPGREVKRSSPNGGEMVVDRIGTWQQSRSGKKA